MSTKTFFLTLCVLLALLVGCGRSKPTSSKATTAEAVAQEDTTSVQANTLPPKSEATPVPPPPPQMLPPPGQNVPFAPLPPGRDPAGDAERRKSQEVAAMQAEAVKRELEQRRIQLQNHPEENQGE